MANNKLRMVFLNSAMDNCWFLFFSYVSYYTPQNQKSMNKKISIIATAVSLALILLTNFVSWDETPLEQSLWALPLGIGLILEMPFLYAASFLGVFDKVKNFLPLIASIFYGVVIYLIAWLWQNKKR